MKPLIASLPTLERSAVTAPREQMLVLCPPVSLGDEQQYMNPRASATDGETGLQNLRERHKTPLIDTQAADMEGWTPSAETRVDLSPVRPTDLELPETRALHCLPHQDRTPPSRGLSFRQPARENPDGPRLVPAAGSEELRLQNMSDATVILAAVEAGDTKAAEQLLELVYHELRRLAAIKMARETPGQTLQPTELVHEAWLRVVGDQKPSFKSREHFFRASAEAMRCILIDRARRKLTQRHGGGCQRIEFENLDLSAPTTDEQLLAVNEALEKFAIEHPVQADLVKLRYFAGMTNEEVAQVLGISISTVKNYWTFSRAWLLNAIEHA